MDIAYDHIQEESLPADAQTSSPQNPSDRPNTDLNSEFQQAFKAVSASPWGARLGGFFATAKKQTETLYSDAQKEYASRSEQAAKGLGELQKSLANTTRNLAINPEAGGANTSFSDPTFSLPESKGKEKAQEDTSAASGAERPDSLPADIVKEATSLVSSLRLPDISRLRTEAAKRLATVQKAEDAADEALLKFGTNIRSFLRDAVTVTAPSSDSNSTEVLFETADAEGKRVIHSSRFDAQLHVIHTSAQSFIQDPQSDEYAAFAKDFNIDGKTADIAADLEKYPELRRAMEKLVPEKVEYAVFWQRYYFLRKVVQEEEARRREVLKGAAQETDEPIAWDSDDEDEDKATTPTSTAAPATTAPNNTTASSTDKTPTASAPAKQTDKRPSHEEDIKSVSSSETSSYDMVSGATSRNPGTPGEEKAPPAKKIEEESDEEDWE